MSTSVSACRGSRPSSARGTARSRPRWPAACRRSSPTRTSAATPTPIRTGPMGWTPSRSWRAPPATSATSTSCSPTTRRRWASRAACRPIASRSSAPRSSALNAELAPFRILHGTELEIRADATLDYPDELLARFDVVIASIHTGRNQSTEQLTKRALAAIEQPARRRDRASRRGGSSTAATRCRSTGRASSRPPPAPAPRSRSTAARGSTSTTRWRGRPVAPAPG